MAVIPNAILDAIFFFINISYFAFNNKTSYVTDIID